MVQENLQIALQDQAIKLGGNVKNVILIINLQYFEEEAEEVSNDDFDKQYKGEISKSGVAILPSKRMRKIPFNTSVSTKDKVSKEKEKPLELIKEVEEKKIIED